MQRIILNWSGGKDAMMTLHHLNTNSDFQDISLLTSINGKRRRITMHGVHETLLQAQVKSLDKSLEVLELPENISMEKYATITRDLTKRHKLEGISHYAYGDINLQDLRDFRDGELSKNDMKPLYPLWNRDTKELASEFIALGYKAKIVAVNANKLDQSFAGREFNGAFLSDLPEDVDPCGENGEFHTYVYDGPLFKEAIPIEVGELTHQTYSPSADDDDCFCDKENQKSWDTGFWFCDLKLIG